MRVSIIAILLSLLIYGCKGDPKQTTERIYLRQINTGNVSTSTASGSFFVLFGTYNSESKMVYKLRALGNFRGEYRFLDLDLNYVSFKLDSSATTPHIVVEYERMQPYPDMLEYFDYLFILRMDNPRYVVTCHPDLVPQQIQQVKI